MAKELLLSGGLSVVAVDKNLNVVFSSKEGGVKPVVDLLMNNKEALRGLYVADKVIGRAAASLFIYAGVKGCFGRIMSDGAALMLKEQGIETFFDKKVPFIKNKNKTDICPMEGLVLDCVHYNECVKRLFEFFKK